MGLSDKDRIGSPSYFPFGVVVGNDVEHITRRNNV